jgi:hypothetical protein
VLDGAEAGEIERRLKPAHEAVCDIEPLTLKSNLDRDVDVRCEQADLLVEQ